MSVDSSRGHGAAGAPLTGLETPAERRAHEEADFIRRMSERTRQQNGASEAGSSGSNSGAASLLGVGVVAVIGFLYFEGSSKEKSPSSDPVVPVAAEAAPPAPTSWTAPLPGQATEGSVLTAGLKLFMKEVVSMPTTESMQDITVARVFDGLDQTPLGQTRFGSSVFAPLLSVSAMSPAMNSGVDLRRAFLCAHEAGQGVRLANLTYATDAVSLNERIVSEATGSSINLAEIALGSSNCAAAFSTLQKNYPDLPEVRVKAKAPGPG